MDSRIKNTFLLLVILQGMHSIEEYVGRLWEVFPPARFLCRLISDNPETGFLIINSGLFILGLAGWFFLIRISQGSYSFQKNIFFEFVIWFWVTIEVVNGIGHPLWAIYQRSYVPGLITAPFLLIVTLRLFKLLAHSSSARSPSG